MKKNILRILLLVLFFTTTQAQQTCEQKIESATKVLTSTSPLKNYAQLFKDIEPCADSGNVIAQNYLGLLYLEGLGVQKNESLGFQYIQKSAQAGCPIAQGNLGRLYKEGVGCNISPAKAVEWFEKGAYNGNSKAAYSLGYMCYKGLGVSQNYNQAVKWFKLSKDPMAKHWLGVCYYFGYGVSQSTELAVEYLKANPTPNSRYFMAHIDAHKKQYTEEEVSKTIAETVQATYKMEAVVLKNAPEFIEDNQTIENKELAGEWIGKFIEYDESGKHIQRILPIEIKFTLDELNDLKTKITFNKQTLENYVLFEDNNLYVGDFKFSLQKQYTHNPKELSLDYHVLGMDLSKKEYNNTSYLLANADVFIENWKETAPPISLVLRPKNSSSLDKDEEAVLLALAEQQEEFIKLYPVPFVEQVHISFELEKEETVQVKITGINNAQTIVIEQGKEMTAGTQIYHANTSHLPTGLYVIKVITESKVYTRIVVKQ